MKQYKDFSDYKSANAFYEKIENGYEKVSMLSNTPSFGMYRVVFGDGSQPTYKQDLAMLGRAMKEKDEYLRRMFGPSTPAEIAHLEVMREIVAEAGVDYESLQASFFLAGFNKQNPKTVAGALFHEPANKSAWAAGKAARNDGSIQRRIRAAQSGHIINKGAQ